MRNCLRPCECSFLPHRERQAVSSETLFIRINENLLILVESYYLLYYDVECLSLCYRVEVERLKVFVPSKAEKDFREWGIRIHQQFLKNSDVEFLE